MGMNLWATNVLKAMMFKQWLKARVPPGVRNSLRLLQRELRSARIHRREAARALRNLSRHEGQLNLHLGCGSRHLAGWINIDLLSAVADYRLDLRRPLPWPEASAARIYSEHFVEHLAYPGELEPFLAECIRVLRPGGLFEAGMPDVQKNLIAYAQGDTGFFKRQRESWWSPSWCVSPLDSINFTFRQGGEHKFAYDFETLARRLQDAGFTDVQRRNWDPQTDSSGWEESLYVSCRKPA
jgi:predicted SAM-dependent methyltransferase